MNRKRVLLKTALLASISASPMVRAQSSVPSVTSANNSIATYVGKAALNTGKVQLEISNLVENGNSVPVTIRVESPMTQTDHVQEIMLFAEKNPQAEVAKFLFSPANGVASVSTRIRLATSQTVTAIAKTSSQQFWQAQVDVIVTLAACIDLD
jgi:sulfur-oxidizing protein SoxY